MKNTIIIISVALISFTSCKKEEAKSNVVKYSIKCESCVAIIDTDKKLNKEFKVHGFLIYSEINKLNSISITTVGTGEIQSILEVNEKIFHNEKNIQTGDTITYKVKIN